MSKNKNNKQEMLLQYVFVFREKIIV